GKGIAHQCLPSAQLGQHAQRLRALARKDKCEGGRHQNFPLSDRKEWWRSMAAAGNCRLDGAQRKAVTVAHRSTLEEHKRPELGNDAAAPQETWARPVQSSRSSSRPCRRCGRFSRTSITARRMALWKPSTVAEPWLFTTMPCRPRKLAPLCRAGASSPRRRLSSGMATAPASLDTKPSLNSASMRSEII